MKLSYQSIAKTETGFTYTNQDAIAISSDKFLYALSDGAGAEGQNTDAWALHLVNSVMLQNCSIFNKPDFENWYIATQKTFTKIQPAYATLAAVSLQNNKWHTCSYGDSGIFIFDKNYHLKYKNINQLFDYTYDPYLLCNNEPFTANKLITHCIPYQLGDILLMATDALSQWIYMLFALQNKLYEKEVLEVYESPYSLGNLIEQNMNWIKQNNNYTTLPKLIQLIKQKLIDKDTFSSFTQTLLYNQCIAFDDYTLLIAH